MELLEYMRRQFAYDAWANGEVLSAMRAHPGPRTLRLMAHVLSAERLWLERIGQQPPSLPVWPDFTIEQCGAQARQTSSLWREYLGELSPTQLGAQVEYKNTKGESFTSSVEEILTHVLLHSAYHRGQIASRTREEGHQPAYTDFIHAARQGLLE